MLLLGISFFMFSSIIQLPLTSICSALKFNIFFFTWINSELIMALDGLENGLTQGEDRMLDFLPVCFYVLPSFLMQVCIGLRSTENLPARPTC